MYKKIILCLLFLSIISCSNLKKIVYSNYYIYRTITLYDNSGKIIQQWSGNTFIIAYDCNSVIFTINEKEIRISGITSIIEN
jgi:hypothetical protein